MLHTHLPTVLLLMRWAEVFRKELLPEIPPTIIRVGRDTDCYGFFRGVRNEFGIPFEITLTEVGLARPLRGKLSTLLHEQIHYWRFLQGQGWFGHDALYRSKAFSLGLLIDERGITKSHVPDGLFLRILAARGIQ